MKPDDPKNIAQENINVLIADDHEMILEMFAIYLQTTASMNVTTCKDLNTAVQCINTQGPFDVVLLDLNMPGMNGVAGLRQAINANADKPVAIITGATSPRMLDEIMSSGAAGIVLKTTGVKSLANAIRFMYSGEHYIPLELMRERYSPTKSICNSDLSRKEMSVLMFLAEGRQNKEIANHLQLAEPTIKMHVTAICRKLGAQNRTQAVVMARDLGIV